MESKTPRTDAEFKLEAFFDGSGIVETVSVEFARELETELAEARAEIENLKWHVSNEKAKAEAALALNDRTLELVNESRADAEHWKSECNALQRMVHEARAEIEKLNNLFANGIECFMTPCDKHSGENTPPFAEFMEKYGHKCTPCLVESLKEARAEIERLKSEHEDSLRRAKDNAVSLSGAVTEYAGELLAKDKQLAEARAEIERKNAVIERMKTALKRLCFELEPAGHDMRGCMFKACKWCDAIAALSGAERGE